MSSVYTKLYNQKKEQFTSGEQKPVLGDINAEIEKVSGVSSARSNSVTRVVKTDKTDRKLAYKSDIEEIKALIQIIEQKIDECVSDRTKILLIKQKIDESISECKTDLEAKIEKQKALFESIKTENLKNIINDTVKQFNENIKNVASQMVTHLEHITEIKSRLDDIEGIL